jgi:hypothetical protein
MFVSKLVLEMDDQEIASTKKEQINSREAGDGDRSLVDTSPEASSGTKHSRITMAVLLRLTAETYLLHDPAAGTPQLRWRNFLAMHDAVCQDAAARGFDDAQAFLPPRIARSFGRRLARLGWSRDPWPCFSRRV